MSARFNPNDLVGGLWKGLRKRRHNADEEKLDVWAILILFGLPLGTFVLIIWQKITFSGADQILAGAALLCGSLIAAFAQIASWRERTMARNRKVELIDVRALNEATAHILISLMVSVVTVFSTFVVSNTDITAVIQTSVQQGTSIEEWLVIVMSAVSGSTFLYIGLSIIIVANLLWDAYNNEEDNQKRSSIQD